MSRRSVSPNMSRNLTGNNDYSQPVPPRRKKRGKSMSLTRLSGMGSSFESYGSNDPYNQMYANSMIQNTFGYDRDAAAFSYYSGWIRPQLKRYMSSDITYSVPTPPAFAQSGYDTESIMKSNAPPLPPRIPTATSNYSNYSRQTMITPSPSPGPPSVSTSRKVPPPLPPRPATLAPGIIFSGGQQDHFENPNYSGSSNQLSLGSITRNKSNSNLKLWKTDEQGNFVKYFPNKQFRGSLSVLPKSDKEAAYQELSRQVQEKYFGRNRSNSVSDLDSAGHVRVTSSVSMVHKAPVIVKSVTSKILSPLLSSVAKSVSKEQLFQTIVAQQHQLATLTQQQNYLQAQVLWHSTHSGRDSDIGHHSEISHGHQDIGPHHEQSSAVSTRSGRSCSPCSTSQALDTDTSSRSPQRQGNGHHHHHRHAIEEGELHHQHSLENRVRKSKSRSKIHEQIAKQQSQVAQHISQLQEQLALLKERKRQRDERVNGSGSRIKAISDVDVDVQMVVTSGAARMRDQQDGSKNQLSPSSIDRPVRPRTPEPGAREQFIKRIAGSEETETSFEESEIANDEEDDPKTWYAVEEKPYSMSGGKKLDQSESLDQPFHGRKGSFKPISSEGKEINQLERSPKSSKLSRMSSDGPNYKYNEVAMDEYNFEVEEEELIPFADSGNKNIIYETDSNNNRNRDIDLELDVEKPNIEDEEEQVLLEEIRREEEAKQVLLLQQNLELEAEIRSKREERERLLVDHEKLIEDQERLRIDQERLRDEEESRLKDVQSEFMKKAEQEMLRQQQEFMHQQKLLLEQQQMLEEQRNQLQIQREEFLIAQEEIQRMQMINAEKLAAKAKDNQEQEPINMQQVVKPQPNRPHRLPRRSLDEVNSSLENLKPITSRVEQVKPPAFPDVRPPPTPQLSRPMSPPQVSSAIIQSGLTVINPQPIRPSSPPRPMSPPRIEDSLLPPPVPMRGPSPTRFDQQPSLQVPLQQKSQQRSPSPSFVQPPSIPIRRPMPSSALHGQSDTFMDHFDHYFMPTSPVKSPPSVSFNENVRGRYISRGNSKETDLSFRSDSKSPEHLLNSNFDISNQGSISSSTTHLPLATLDDTILSSTANKIRHLQASGDPLSSVRGLSPFNSRRQTLPDVIKALDIDTPVRLASVPSSKVISYEAPPSLASIAPIKNVLDSRKKSVFAENPLPGPPEGWNREKVAELAHAAREAKLIADSNPKSRYSLNWSSIGSWFWDKKLGILVLAINTALAYYFYSILLLDPQFTDPKYDPKTYAAQIKSPPPQHDMYD